MTLRQEKFIEALKTSKSYSEAMLKAGYSKSSSRAGSMYEKMRSITKKKSKGDNNKLNLRNKADRLLQEYIKNKHKGELCWFCGERPIWCGHHFIYKSQSLSCRFYIPNIIPVCKECHRYAHTWQNLFNAKISIKIGEGWLKDIEEQRKNGAKFTSEWVQTQYQILQDLNNRREVM